MRVIPMAISNNDVIES